MTSVRPGTVSIALIAGFTATGAVVETGGEASCKSNCSSSGVKSYPYSLSLSSLCEWIAAMAAKMMNHYATQGSVADHGLPRRVTVDTYRELRDADHRGEASTRVTRPHVIASRQPPAGEIAIVTCSPRGRFLASVDWSKRSYRLTC